MRKLAWLGALLVAGCTISASPVQDITGGSGGDAATTFIVTKLQDAAWNLDQAVAVGALDKDDPAPGCLHKVLLDLGAEGPALPSFTPRRGDLFTEGSIAYIRIQQLKKLRSGGLDVPMECDAIVGMIVRDVLRQGISIGKGLLPIPKFISKGPPT